MLRINIGVPHDFFKAAREFPTRVTRRFNVRLQTNVLPELQQNVRDLIVEPGPVVHPFEFSTAKSRRWYFANKVPKGSRGGSYRRTHRLIQAWTVVILRISEKQYIVITNEDPASKYVYGLPFLDQFHTLQRQVPGHARTGWGNDELRAAITLIQENAIALIQHEFQETVREERRA